MEQRPFNHSSPNLTSAPVSIPNHNLSSNNNFLSTNSPKNHRRSSSFSEKRDWFRNNVLNELRAQNKRFSKEPLNKVTSKKKRIFKILFSSFQLIDILNSLGLSKYQSKFEKEEIYDLETFMSLTENHLKDMGILIGPRKKILKFIRERNKMVHSTSINCNFQLIFLFFANLKIGSQKCNSRPVFS